MEHATVRSERWFDVLLTTDSAQAATMTLAPGRETGGPDNRHPESDQWLYVVSGAGTATVGERTVDLAAGDLLLVEAGEPHALAADDAGPLETLSLYVPPEY